MGRIYKLHGNIPTRPTPHRRPQKAELSDEYEHQMAVEERRRRNIAILNRMAERDGRQGVSGVPRRRR
jgi:hypothetical protein